MKKRCKVVMLPTKEKSNILNDSLGLRYNSIPLDNSLRYSPQHLYIISDDEIKEGDWYYSSEDNAVRQWIDYYSMPMMDCDRIIATTDKSLKIKSTCNCSETEAIYCGEEKSVGKCQQSLPSPSEAFIKKYCEAGGIDEVDVEYEYKTEVHTGEYVLKVDSHNTITTIHPVKDNWTREEVEALIRKYQDTFGIMGGDSSFVTSWIKENM